MRCSPPFSKTTNTECCACHSGLLVFGSVGSNFSVTHCQTLCCAAFFSGELFIDCLCVELIAERGTTPASVQGRLERRIRLVKTAFRRVVLGHLHQVAGRS